MRARRTHLSNGVFRLEGGNEDTDLWAETRTIDGVPAVLTVWEPTPAERAALAAGHNVLLVTFAEHPPAQAMTTADVPLGAPPRPLTDLP